MALRQEIVSAVSFVLRLRIGQRLKRALGMREETDAHILAEQIVSHLERCRFRFSQEPPHAAHGTPDALGPQRSAAAPLIQLRQQRRRLMRTRPRLTRSMELPAHCTS